MTSSEMPPLRPSTLVADVRIIGFDGDPDEVTARLNVAPSRVFRRGDPVPRTAMRRKQHAWIVGVSEGPYGSLDPVVTQVLQPLPETLAVLADLRGDWEALVAVAVFLRGDQPELKLRPGTIRRVARLPAAVDFDLYALAEEVLVPASIGKRSFPIEEGEPERTTMAAAFVVVGTGWEPPEVTRLLGVTPSVTRREGEGSEGAAWMIEVAEGPWSELDALVRGVLRPLPETLDGLVALGGNWAAEVRVAIYQRDGMPVGTIEAATVRRMAALQAGFDLRVSVMPATRRAEPEDW